jgi:post-segregation antitoxin (ccd killing protein)
VSGKKKKARTNHAGEWPILAVRIPHDVARVLEALEIQTGKKFKRSRFVREAIIKELEHEYNMKWLIENGYIMPDGARRNENELGQPKY